MNFPLVESGESEPTACPATLPRELAPKTSSNVTPPRRIKFTFRPSSVYAPAAASTSPVYTAENKLVAPEKSEGAPAGNPRRKQTLAAREQQKSCLRGIGGRGAHHKWNEKCTRCPGVRSARPGDKKENNGGRGKRGGGEPPWAGAFIQMFRLPFRPPSGVIGF